MRHAGEQIKEREKVTKSEWGGEVKYLMCSTSISEDLFRVQHTKACGDILNDNFFFVLTTL